MIFSRDYMPKYICEHNRDVHTMLRLLDLVINNQKAKSDDFINILNPSKCPNTLLPLLSSYFGYKYDYNENYDRNRVILKSYKDLIRNRGSKTGVGLATSVSIAMVVNKSIIDTQNLFNVSYYDKFYKCNNCNYVAYSQFDVCPTCGSTNISLNDEDTIVIVMSYPIYSSKIYDLIETVRPAGTNCLIFNGSIVNQKETMDIYDYIRLQSGYLNVGKSSVGGNDSNVGFVEILPESQSKFRYCKSCGYHFEGYDYSIFSIERTYKTNDIVLYDDNGAQSFYKCRNNNTVGKPPTNTSYWNNLGSATSCPRCGNLTSVVEENKSDLKLIYKLYNDNQALDRVNRILNDSVYNPITNNIGVVVRFNVQHKDAENSKWDIDMKDSFIFGMKPYIKLLTGDTICKYPINTILDNMVESNETNLKMLKNRAHTNWSYDMKKDDTTDNEYAVKVTTAPYTTIIDGRETIVQDTYPYKLSKVTISSLHNLEDLDTVSIFSGVTPVDGVWSYSFKKTDNVGKDNKPLYESNDLPYCDFRIFENKINNNVGITYDYYQCSNCGHKETHYFNTCSECGLSDTVVAHDSDTVKNIDKYMNVCKSCSTLIVGNEDVSLCPKCAGYVDSENSVSSLDQLYNPTILKGSYVIDLYFGD